MYVGFPTNNILYEKKEKQNQMLNIVCIRFFFSKRVFGRHEAKHTHGKRRQIKAQPAILQCRSYLFVIAYLSVDYLV